MSTRANPEIVRDVLARSRARLALPARWCRGALARDGHGNPLNDALHPSAASWSVQGAAHFALHERRADMRLPPDLTPLNGPDGVAVMLTLARLVGVATRDHGAACRAVADWADKEDRKHGEIVALFTTALAEASPRPRAAREAV